MGMVSHYSSSGDTLHKHTSVSITSGSEFEVVYWAIGILIIVTWWIIESE